MDDKLIAKETEGLEQETALALRNTFMPFFEEAEQLAKQARDIVVTSIEQTEEMERARQARLSLKRIRVSVENTRKQLKEESLRKGKAIDGMANIIKYLITPIEEHLQKQEDFIKLEQERIKAELQDKRIKLLEPYEVDIQFYNLKEMSEESFNQLLETSKKNFEARIELERQEEEKRIAREKAEAEEREKVKAENERLKKELEEKERIRKQEETKRLAEEKKRKAKEDAERKKQEEQLQKEREEKARIEKELREKQEAEEKAKREIEEKERKAKLAPDKQKLEALAVQIVSMPLPELKSDEAKAILKSTVDLLNKTSAFIKEKCCNL